MRSPACGYAGSITVGRMTRLVLNVIVLAFLALCAACGGGDADDDEGQKAVPTRPAASAGV